MYKSDEHMEKALALVCQSYCYMATDIVFIYTTFSLFNRKETRRKRVLFLLNNTIALDE